MLKAEEIKHNQDIFTERYNKYIGNQQLLDYLGDDFFTAPASHRTDLYNAFPGGLVDHILRMTTHAVKLNNNLPEILKVDNTSLIKVCFLSQIGKTFMYQVNDSQWHVKNGMPYKYVDNLVSMHVGERSIFYINSISDIALSEEEYQAVLNLGKTDDKQAEFHTEMLGEILRMANIIAIKEEKRLAENG